MKQAIVLLSGGIDSTTTLYIAMDRGYKCRCLIFDYNQHHRKEIFQAEKIAKKAKCDYKIIKISFPWLGSSLLDKRMKMPLGRNIDNMTKGIPSTYVPSRNTIFISVAAAWAEAIGADTIFIGANAVDFSGYPDCRPEYFELFNRLLERGTKTGVEGKSLKIITPLIRKNKAQIITLGKKLGVPFELTWSCYEGGRVPCGKCDSCYFRARGFKEAGIKDPLIKK